MGLNFLCCQIKKLCKCIPIKLQNNGNHFHMEKSDGSESSVALCNGNYFFLPTRKAPLI